MDFSTYIALVPLLPLASFVLLGLFGKKYKCSTCGAKFKTEAEMMEHGKMHPNQPAPKSAGSK